MNELLIAIFYISCFLVLFPFIVYCIMVFIDKYDNILIYSYDAYLDKLQKKTINELLKGQRLDNKKNQSKISIESLIDYSKYIKKHSKNNSSECFLFILP